MILKNCKLLNTSKKWGFIKLTKIGHSGLNSTSVQVFHCTAMSRGRFDVNEEKVLLVKTQFLRRVGNNLWNFAQDLDTLLSLRKLVLKDGSALDVLFTVTTTISVIQLQIRRRY